MNGNDLDPLNEKRKSDAGVPGAVALPKADELALERGLSAQLQNRVDDLEAKSMGDSARIAQLEKELEDARGPVDDDAVSSALKGRLPKRVTLMEDYTRAGHFGTVHYSKGDSISDPYVIKLLRDSKAPIARA